MPSPSVQFYSPQAIEQLAETIIEKFHRPSDSLPVEIDVIAERDLRVNIMPFSGLRQRGLHGYLALSRKTIYIDEYLMNEDYCENRYRFTVAEEVGHLLLHTELFKNVATPDDYFKALDRITTSEVAQMDSEAKHLGEAILMPAELFRARALSYANESSKSGPLKKSEVYQKLSIDFMVSTEAVNYRFSHLGLCHQIVF